MSIIRICIHAPDGEFLHLIVDLESYPIAGFASEAGADPYLVFVGDLAERITWLILLRTLRCVAVFECISFGDYVEANQRNCFLSSFHDGVVLNSR
jgi:hypothetical protein